MLWNDHDCLLRYRQLESTRSELFSSSGLGAFRILSDEPMMERAKSDAGALRAKHVMAMRICGSASSAAIPTLSAARGGQGARRTLFGPYNRLIEPAGVVVLPHLGADVVVMLGYGTRSWHYEFPRGVVKPSQETTTRSRSLLEEIGARADRGGTQDHPRASREGRQNSRRFVISAGQSSRTSRKSQWRSELPRKIQSRDTPLRVLLRPHACG